MKYIHPSPVVNEQLLQQPAKSQTGSDVIAFTKCGAQVEVSQNNSTKYGQGECLPVLRLSLSAKLMISTDEVRWRYVALASVREVFIILRRTHDMNGLNFGMVMYPDHHQR